MSEYRDIETLLAEVRARRQRLQSDRVSDKKDPSNPSQTPSEMVRLASQPISNAVTLPESSKDSVQHEQKSPPYVEEAISPSVTESKPLEEPSPLLRKARITQWVLYRNLIAFCARYPLIVFSALLFLICAACGLYILSEFKKFSI